MKKEFKKRAICFLLKLVLVLMTTFMTSVLTWAQSLTLSAPGAGSWVCPVGVTSVTVQCWGAGGGGGFTGNNNNDKGGGGGAGAYARSVLTTVPGQTYNFYVGRGILENDGENTVFGANLVLASGGKRGANGSGGNQGAAGLGATAISSIGTFRFNGGNAFNFYGGGGAGSTGAGGNATISGPGTGTANNGGNGSGIIASGDGVNGLNYGGGGSGATKKNRVGSAGGGGLIVLSFSCPSFGTVSAGNNQTFPCLTTATLSASSVPTGMTGTWTLISGTGSIAYPNLAQTTVSGLTLGQTSVFQWTISNGGCGSSSSTVSITANYGSGCWNYCIPTGNVNCAIGDYISRVQFNSIDRYSSCETNGYISTGESTTLFSGQAYTLSVTNGTNGNGNCAAWIDWNDNGVFESSEYYLISNNMSPNSTISIPITAGATNGSYRLRIRYLQSTTISSTLSCNSLGLYGETEDYTINICTLPLQPNIIDGAPTVCAMAANSYTTTPVSGVNYQWNFSGTGTISGTGAGISLTPENSGLLSVIPINACGSGPSRTLLINVNTLSTFAIIDSVYGSVCPNTDFTLTASGGIAGTGSQIHWYSGRNGTGLAYGVGNSITIHLQETDTVFIRREGQCNTTGETFKIIKVKSPVYAYSLATTNVYCTDVYGWNHWYSNDSIIFSARGNFSNAPSGFPIVTILRNNAYHQNRTLPLNPSLCASNLFPGEEQFEMARCWNLDMGSGSPQGTYDIRFYYSPTEKQEIEDAALTWMAAYPDCNYSFKYTTPNGFYWFKNSGTNYIAPQWDGSKYTATDSSINGVNYSQWTGLVSFSGGSGAIILSPNELLPIEWVSFEGKNQGLVNVLEWQTAGEENSSNFEIQRSADAINFEIIGTLAAAGNNLNLSSYEFTDISPFRGTNYYRLKLNNLDSSASYSKIVNVENNPAESAYSFYPNPTKDILYYISNSKISERLDIKVLNTLGNVVMTFYKTIVPGQNQTAIDLSFLNSGTYLLQIFHRDSAVLVVEVVNKH